jgi:hypothetical protein
MQRDRVGKETPVLVAQIAETRLAQPIGKHLAFGAWACGIQADLAVLRDVPRPLQMPGIALLGRFIEAPGRDDPLELCALADQENRA